MPAFLIRALFLLAACGGTLGALAQQTIVVRELGVTIDGTSNLHDWTSRVTQRTATASARVVDGRLQDLTSFELSIPVTGILSSNGRIMDNKTHEALRAEKFPTIGYVQTGFRQNISGAGVYTLRSTGQLSLGGQTRTVVIVGTGTLKGGVLSVAGSTALKMSDFGIDAPTAILGTLRTGDSVTVNFHFDLDLAAVTGSR